MSLINVINISGEKEPFSKIKVYRSAKRVGSSSKTAREIANIINDEAYEGIKTSKIFSRIKQLLRKESLGLAIKFNIKDGIRKLGPTGFPFEKYVAAIFNDLGFKVEINLSIPGKCVKGYEIDFIAKKDNLVYIGECKYKMYSGDRVDTNDALANYARFLDISAGSYFKKLKYKDVVLKTILVTNSKFSGRAIDYCKCVGAELLGWKTPKGQGLEHFIDGRKLYPITILPGLKGYLRDVLVEERIMLARDLLKINAKTFSQERNIPLKQIQDLIKQAEKLLQ
jgi:Holliday junction resolvase